MQQAATSLLVKPILLKTIFRDLGDTTFTMYDPLNSL